MRLRILNLVILETLGLACTKFFLHFFQELQVVYYNFAYACFTCTNFSDNANHH